MGIAHFLFTYIHGGWTFLISSSHYCMLHLLYSRVSNEKNWPLRFNLPCNIPHILGPVPKWKSRLGADLYQLLVVEIHQNTCKSRDKMLQLLQNYFICHHTDSQCSLISFLVSSHLWCHCNCWILVITHSGWNFENTFYFFVPGAQSNKDNKILLAQTWLVTVKLLRHTVIRTKFENCLSSGWAKFHQKLQQNHWLLAL